MSRSYKKSPVYTDGSARGTKISKRFANKKVRNTNFDDLPKKGKGYKKCFESYDIHDFISYYTEKECIKDWEKECTEIENQVTKYRFYPQTKEEVIKKWRKNHKWK